MVESTPSPQAAFDAPAGAPGSRRIGSLTAAIRREMTLGPFTRPELTGVTTAAVTAALASLLPVPWLVQTGIAIGLGAILGTAVARRAIPAPVRRALEAFGYLGEWELDRAAALGTGPIATPDAARRWLDATPERPADRWFRWEVALLADRPDEAAMTASRIPDTTPYGRFERAYAEDRVRWMTGGPSDLETVRTLAEAVGGADDPDRRHAEVAVAVAHATELASAGASPLPPLVAVRDRLPDELGLGRRYVEGLRTLMLVASVVLSLVVPATVTLLRAVLATA